MYFLQLKQRIFQRVLSFSAASLLCVSCGENVGATQAEDDFSNASLDPVTWVDQTEVERQSIGNCWLYAGASWAESLHKAATGESLNTSQSYTTYWHWFDQIYRGARTISTGGSYSTVVDLYLRYGMMLQSDFIESEAKSEMSARQASALEAINASLASGALSTSAARRDRALVRAELDKAWRLTPTTIALLDEVFGPAVNKTLDRAYVATAPNTVEGKRVMRPVDIDVRAKKAGSTTFETKTLADVIGSGWSRSGPYAWRQAYYPSSATSRRTYQKRVQRALHDHQPVIVSWFVDFNALGRDGSFSLENLEASGRPGSQGGHMVVMHDYEVENVPGFGTLKAGEEETRPEALEAALSDEAQIRFFRIKNSWGKYRPDRWDQAPMPGYHDLYRTYLDGPIKKCSTSTPSNCTTNTVPLWDTVLPPGY